MDYTLRIGGEAGQGLQTIGGALAKIFSRLRYQVFTHQDYMSRIRGGHNYYQIRVSEKPVSASRDTVHILVAMDQNTIDIHAHAVHKNGVILYDPAMTNNDQAGNEFLPIPFADLAEKSGGKKLMANSAAIGAVLGLLGLETGTGKTVIQESLTKKDEKIIEGNIRALEAGHRYAQEQSQHLANFSTGNAGDENLMLINGIQAIALGAITAGCKFYSAYPMTPSTGVMVYLAGKSETHNIIVEQAEDEISAINMAIGASFAGVRSMTGTSGGGFALMTEGVSLAAMTETPIVICEMQRPGPATGLPTRTEQGDLLFVLHGGHGEFPKVIFTPGTPEQAFLATNKAFDLAEKYQIPVFIQGDQYLADTEWTNTGFPLDQLTYKDYRLRTDKLEELGEYNRYSYREDGISPLAIPGDSEHLVVVDSDEHDEAGHIIEDSETRNRMTEKRIHKKINRIKLEINPPELYGSPHPEIMLICYGSTYGIVKEVVDLLSGKQSIAMLHFGEVYPFPLADSLDYPKFIQYARQAICIESNATGQFARLLHSETGIHPSDQVNRYDGRPFTVDSLLAEITQKITKRNPHEQ